MTKRLLLIAALLCAAALSLRAQSPETRRQFHGTQPKPAGAPLQMPWLRLKPTTPTSAPAPTQQPAAPADGKPRVVHRQSRQHPTRDFDWRDTFQPDFSLAADWRSMLLRDGWVASARPVGTLQAEMTESGGYIGLFGAYDFSRQRDDHWNFAEARAYLGYAVRCLNEGPLGTVTVDAGWAYTAFPSSGEDRFGELHLDLHWDELLTADTWRLTAEAGYAWNYDDSQNTLHVGAAHTWLLQPEGRLGWTNRAALFWGDGPKARSLAGRGGPMFYGLDCTSRLRWQFAQGWTLAPYAGVLLFPDHRAERAARKGRIHRAAAFHAGCAVEWSF